MVSCVSSQVSQVNRELDAALVDESKIKAEDEDDEVDMRHNAGKCIPKAADV